jgi:hypothetical protein
MTQKNVEMVIGRLVTDADFRRRFARDPEGALASLKESGVELNRVETEELLAIDPRKFEVLDPVVSSRLQRAGFAPDPRHTEKGGPS